LKTRRVSSEQVSQLLRVIEEVTKARNRSQAIEELVTAIAVQFPGAHVRCGLGQGRMKRFYDRRLGWLGGESSLHQAAEANWAKLPLDAADCHVLDDSFALALPEPEGRGRCVVWVEGEQVLDAPRDWLLSGLPTLRLVLWQRPLRSWSNLLHRLGLGSTFWLAAAMSALFLLVAWPVPYRISCTAVVEPLQQRLVAAPFEAKLLEAKVKPGDTVTAGQTLVVLDGRPLRLELESIEAERQQAAKQNDMALAAGRIADAQQAALKERQLARRKQLINDRLSNLRVVSPIAGVVVSGDLERFVGAPLDTGQTLLEVAPLDRMAIEVEIPEYEIGYITPESDTKIKIAAIGGKSLRMPLADVYPSAEIRDDRNVFVGRVEIENRDGKLRPGMRGEATTYGPLRPLAWSWLRGAFERVLWWVGY
jgi:biotin carboxyl carrier protein